MKNLQGKTAVIIGAATGIGKATVFALARRGVRVLMADINEKGMAEVVAEANAKDYTVSSTFCDVSRSEAFTELRETALNLFGSVDIVMNNVGVLTCGRPEDIPLSEWERILNINLMSVVRGVHCFMPDMIARQSGHIVNTASFAGLFPYAYDRLPYASSKAAIIAMSEGLALYLKPQGVGITCLCPGPVKTEIASTMKTWSKDIQLRGPGDQFEMQDAERTGEMVADAIIEDKFMLVTHPAVVESLLLRAADFDSFLDKQISAMDVTVSPSQSS